MPTATRKPEWLRVKVDLGEGYRDVKRTMRSLKLVTVCEEAGCPNIYECWRDGTATFMINGEQCTRACGFCQVDTSRPMPVDPAEPERLAEAVADMGLAHAVITAVARDDLPDGGAAGFAESIRAIRRRCPGTAVEVLIPDCKGRTEALAAIFDARPDVLNHNLETVARLQRHVRPSASYARSLSVLARAAAAGLVTKSGIILGLGRDGGRGGGGHDRPPAGRRLDPHPGPVPAALRRPPSGGPVVDAGGVRPAGRHGPGARLRPRGGVTAHPVELPRPPGGGGRGGPSSS